MLTTIADAPFIRGFGREPGIRPTEHWEKRREFVVLTYTLQQETKLALDSSTVQDVDEKPKTKEIK